MVVFAMALPAPWSGVAACEKPCARHVANQAPRPARSTTVALANDLKNNKSTISFAGARGTLTEGGVGDLRVSCSSEVDGPSIINFQILFYI